MSQSDSTEVPPELSPDLNSPPLADVASQDSLPPPPPPPPLFGFRTHSRDFHKSFPPRWDEFCVQWCKQMNSRREVGQSAVCRMACLRRKKRDENVSKAHADIDSVEAVHNVEKTVETNKNDAEKNEVKPNGSKWNPLDGYYFYYVKGVDKCVRHTEGICELCEGFARSNQTLIDLTGLDRNAYSNSEL